jgi:ribosomal protein L7Ae-like RNA K-turn-binding protein
MKNEDDFLRLMGFARKSGNLVSGESAVLAFLKKKKIKLLVLAKDISEKNKENWLKTGAEFNTEIIFLGSKLSLGKALGSSPRTIVGIKDEKFAVALNNIFKEITGGD